MTHVLNTTAILTKSRSDDPDISHRTQMIPNVQPIKPCGRRKFALECQNSYWLVPICCNIKIGQFHTFIRCTQKEKKTVTKSQLTALQTLILVLIPIHIQARVSQSTYNPFQSNCTQRNSHFPPATHITTQNLARSMCFWIEEMVLWCTVTRFLYQISS